MLHAKPKGWSTWDFSLLGPAGEVIADILFSAFREKGSVVVKGLAYPIRRDGWLGPFILEGPDGLQKAVAEKPSAFFRQFVVSHGGRRYVLKAISALDRGMGLFREDAQIGTITPESTLGRGAQVEFAEEIPVLLQAFLVWLILLLWKREDAGASPQGNP